MNRVCFLVLFVFLSSCAQVSVRRVRESRGHPPSDSSTPAYRMHHSVVWGFISLSDPINLDEECPNGWEKIVTRVNWYEFLLRVVTLNLYSPQDIGVVCNS